MPTVFVNATYTTPLALGQNRMESGRLFSVTPRLERRWFSVGLPVSVYEWQQFQVGAAARLGFLTLGTDRLGGILGTRQFSGADFYFALKLSPLWNQGAKKAKAPKRKRSKKGGGGLPCYKW